MREEIERMYASGEIERILRFCKVKEEDLQDFQQEVVLLLLTQPPRTIRHLGRYIISLTRRQYFTCDNRSKWWKKEGRWKSKRTELQGVGGEILAETDPLLP